MTSDQADRADQADQVDPALIGLAFALFDRMRAHGHARAAELGLTPNEAGVLLMLNPEEAIPAQTLANRLGHDTGNLTRLLTRLEERQLVERRSVPADRRVRQITLTAHGAQLRARLHSGVSTSNPLTTGLSVQQRNDLHHLLSVLAAHASPDLQAQARPRTTL